MRRSMKIQTPGLWDVWRTLALNIIVERVREEREISWRDGKRLIPGHSVHTSRFTFGKGSKASTRRAEDLFNPLQSLREGEDVQ
ncbi:MAG: hypothetical protein QXI51_03005 [Candidatus Korarchaeum sp.]